MILNDLIEKALTSRRLQNEAHSMSADEQAFFLDLVASANNWEAPPIESGDNLVCIPYSDEGDIRFCFLPEDHFLSRFRPTYPHLIGRLTNPIDAQDTLREVVGPPLFKSHTFLEAPWLIYEDLDVLLGAKLPPVELDLEDVAVAFLRMRIRLPEQPKAPADPFAHAVALECALRDAYPFFSSGVTLNDGILEKICNNLSGMYYASAVVLRCSTYITQKEAVAAIETYCKDHHICLAKVRSSELERFSPPRSDALFGKDLVLISGRVDLCLARNARHLHTLFEHHTPLVIITTDLDDEVDVFYAQILEDPYVSIEEYLVDRNRKEHSL